MVFDRYIMMYRTCYLLVIKHGVLKNPPFTNDFPSYRDFPTRQRVLTGGYKPTDATPLEPLLYIQWISFTTLKLWFQFQTCLYLH